MREPAAVTDRDGYRASIYRDPEPQSPKDWDQLGRLVTWHRRYVFDQDGRQDFGDPADFLRLARRHRWIFIPAGMIDHSGIRLYEGSGSPHPYDPDGLDSAQVGYIYATRESMARMGTTPQRAKRVLRQELEAWDQYVSGDVWGVVVTGPDREYLDSCWGFYGHDYAKGKAEQMLNDAIKYERQESEKIARSMAL
jgi:hypothetical protein